MKKITTIKELVLELTKHEALKRQVDVAQMSEIIGRLSDLAYHRKFQRIAGLLKDNGKKRAKK